MSELDKTAQIIQKRRKAMKMSQKELAKRLGVQPTTISRWETAQGYPDQGIIAKLAFELGITTDELYGAKELRMPKEKSKKFTWVEFCIILVKIITIGAIFALFTYTIVTRMSKEYSYLLFHFGTIDKLISSLILCIIAMIFIVFDRFKIWMIKKTYRFRYKHEYPVGYEFTVQQKYLLYLNVKFSLIIIALVLLIWLS